MAEELAATGINLVLVPRRHEALDNLAAELTAQHGITTRVHSIDLARPAGASHLVAATADLDVGLLIAAAGCGTSGPLLDSSLERELDMVDVNCRAVLALCFAFGQRFALRRSGGIVLFSSIVAFQGVPFAANYAATKAYVQALAEGLHAELAPLGVNVVASAPGPVHSGFAARAGMRMGRALAPGDIAQPSLAALGRRTTVRPGRLSKLLDGALAPLPRPVRVRVMGRIMAGMATPTSPRHS